MYMFCDRMNVQGGKGKLFRENLEEQHEREEELINGVVHDIIFQTLNNATKFGRSEFQIIESSDKSNFHRKPSHIAV